MNASYVCGISSGTSTKTAPCGCPSLTSGGQCRCMNVTERIESFLSREERQQSNKLTSSFSLKQSSIPLERHHIEELIDRLDRDRTGMVDYRWVCLQISAGGLCTMFHRVLSWIFPSC